MHTSTSSCICIVIHPTYKVFTDFEAFACYFLTKEVKGVFMSVQLRPLVVALGLRSKGFEPWSRRYTSRDWVFPAFKSQGD